MTTPLSGAEVAQRIGQAFPQAAAVAMPDAVLIRPPVLLEVARYLRDTPDLAFDFLASVTAVDYIDYFELVYHLTSIVHNHSLILKARCYGRENPQAPSVCSVWPAADFQEREIYDLMGVSFIGHPNLKRILTWEGFPGHPLRKDFLEQVRP